MISLDEVQLVVEAAPDGAGSVLAEEGDLDLLDHLVVTEAEKEGDGQALAGGRHRGHHLVDVFYRGAWLWSHRQQEKM